MDTVENPSELETAFFITECIAQTGIFGLNGPTTPIEVESDSGDYDSGIEVDSASDDGVVGVIDGLRLMILCTIFCNVGCFA